jgi:hypothetical protein
MYSEGQKIKLRRDICDTEEWVVTPKLFQFSKAQTTLTITKVGTGTVLIEEVSQNTFVDVCWISSWRENKLPEDLFTL